MTTNKADNAKIQAAMTARAEESRARRAEAQRARRAKAQAEKIARSQAEEDRTRPIKQRRRRVSLEEKIAKGRAKVAARKVVSLPPEVIPYYGPTRAVRVLPDPVDNARLIRMRAKWTAERGERKAARIEEKYGEQSVEAGIARAVVADLWSEERELFRQYRVLSDG